jgi:hypothetical protein
MIPGQEGVSVENSMKEEKSVTELQGATYSNEQEENRYEIMCYSDNETICSHLNCPRFIKWKK